MTGKPTNRRHFSVAPLHGVLEGENGLDPVAFARAVSGIVSGRGAEGEDGPERRLVQRMVESAIADLAVLEDRASSISYFRSVLVRQHLEWIGFDPDVWVPALLKLAERTRVTRCARMHPLAAGATYCPQCRTRHRDLRRNQRAKRPRSRFGAAVVAAVAVLSLLVAVDTPAQTVALAPAAPGLTPVIACVEPTTDDAGRALPAEIAAGGLAGCFAQITVSGLPFWASWLRPDSPRGGKRHELGQHLPSYIGSYPLEVSCACWSVAGWGPSRRGTIGLALTILP